jgi:hypothetical protein
MSNLITSFIYDVRTTFSGAKVYSQTAQLEHSANVFADFPKLAEFLQWFPSQKNKPDMTHT